jgi:molybdopterin molybdotransferase
MTPAKPAPMLAADGIGHHAEPLSVSQVSSLLSRLVLPVTQAEEVSIAEALNRVIAIDVISPVDVPPHDNSAMDGYAFEGALLETSPKLTLKVIGTALAGKTWQGQIQAGECIKIMTGAVMPDSLNTVVPQEFCTVSDQHITFDTSLVLSGHNRRLQGEDLKINTPAIQRGARVTPAVMGLLASLGLPTVKVIRRLKVAYFSTGDEILALGEAPREGAVYDSNRYTLLGLLQSLGCTVVDLGIIPDQAEAMEKAFQEAARKADVVITSGGVSGGDADFTQAMLKKLGDVAFWKIDMRPGRPMAVGHLKDKESCALLFGLPGNPVAAMVTFLAFVKPALLQMMGNSDLPAPLLRAKTQVVLRKKSGRTEYQRGIVSRNDQGELQVITTGNQGSGILSSMVHANCLLVLSHTQSTAQVGDWVDVLML